jgi:antagonist of KipI
MIKVIQPGLQTTIQDQGRFGYQCYGISVGGAMSTFSSRLANILVGNEMNVPVLEMVQSPHSFLYKELSLFEPLQVEAGTVINLHKPAEGFRLYMAVAGGFKSEIFLNSYSTHLLTCSGGYMGRAIKKNDRLFAQNKPSKLAENIRHLLQRNFYFNIDQSLSPKIFSKSIRIIKGAEFELLTDESKQNLINSQFAISNEYSRMGYHLKSVPLLLTQKKEMVSSAVNKGTIQLLTSGQTIALMADCQTMGGYPRIAHIIGADHCICAQLKPNDEISFIMVSVTEAEQLYLEQEDRLQQIQEKVHQIFS